MRGHSAESPADRLRASRRSRPRPDTELARGEVAAFVATMPERYGDQVDRSSAREHTCIVRARERRPLHAELFGADSPQGPGLCVVAPDAPGLLAAISAALMLEGFDVTRADAYTRRADGVGYEAVDLFWVRRAGVESGRPLLPADVVAVRATLGELLRPGGTFHFSQRMLAGTTPGTAETSVRFVERTDVPWLTLELESNDRTGLLLAVSAALFAQGVQIVGSQIRTSGLRVHDRFDLVEPDGSRIAGTRLQRLELAVVSAVDGPFHRSAERAPGAVRVASRVNAGRVR